MSSILTNNGAMVALQTLKGVNNAMAKTQNEISTGKTVASAKDNAAVWAISKVMETDQTAFKAIQDQLGVAQSTVGVGLAGAEEITKLLREMKDLAAGAANSGADFNKIDTDVKAKMAQIGSIVNASQSNGINLLKGNVDGTNPTYRVLSSLDRTSGTVATQASDITVNGLAFDAAAGQPTAISNATVTTINSAATAKTAIGEIEGLLDISIKGAATLGSTAKRISDQKDFVGKLSDALKAGIGALVDADMEETSARLQALQVQQQLGVQALSIANQAPQSVLSLFR